MIIRAKTFRQWFIANLSDSAKDIANNGADCGFFGLTYTADTVKLFDRFDHEIWDMAYEDTESMGSANVAEFIAGFGRSDMLENVDSFKNLMVWYAAERIARELTDEQE